MSRGKISVYSETVQLIGDPIKSTICCLNQIKCLTRRQTRAFNMSALSLQLLIVTLQLYILELQSLIWCECSETNGNSQITTWLLRSSAKEAWLNVTNTHGETMHHIRQCPDSLTLFWKDLSPVVLVFVGVSLKLHVFGLNNKKLTNRVFLLFFFKTR